MLAISLFWLGVILVAVALLLLFWDSFKYRKAWALISLILIIPLVVHMFINWSRLNSRKAFYLLLLGILSITVSIVGGALSQLHFLPEHEVVQVLEENIAPPKDDPLPNQEQADAAAEAIDESYDPLLTGSEYETLGAKEIIPEDINKDDPNATAARYQQVTLEERVHAVNKWVRLKTANGEIIEGRLTNVLEDAVLIEANVNGGILGLSHKNEDISEMFVRLEAGEELIKSPPQEIDESQAIVEDGQEVIVEKLSSEIKELEDTSIQGDTGTNEITNEVLEKIENIVDDSEISQESIE